MRENIGLYRGKRIDNHEWVEGYLVTVTIVGKRFCLILAPCEGEIRLDGGLLQLALNAIEKGKKVAGMSDKNGNSYFVDPKTVGECTGVPDKNGKKIFEGDIVRCIRTHCDGRKVVGHIIFENCCFCVKRGINRPAMDLCDDFEVIGNIHDNPELLEDAE